MLNIKVPRLSLTCNQSLVLSLSLVLTMIVDMIHTKCSAYTEKLWLVSLTYGSGNSITIAKNNEKGQERSL